MEKLEIIYMLLVVDKLLQTPSVKKRSLIHFFIPFIYWILPTASGSPSKTTHMHWVNKKNPQAGMKPCHILAERRQLEPLLHLVQLNSDWFNELTASVQNLLDQRIRQPSPIFVIYISMFINDCILTNGKKKAGTSLSLQMIC